jgi:hypothetical protein
MATCTSSFDEIAQRALACHLGRLRVTEVRRHVVEPRIARGLPAMSSRCSRARSERSGG